MVTAILQHKYKIILVAAVMIALRCWWLWQPERQVRLHQLHLLEAAGNRNLSKFAGFFDDGFRTPTGKDKAWALQQSQVVLSQFLTLEVHASDTAVAMEGSGARVRSLIRLEGKGMELGEMAKRAVNESTVPFEFTWKHESWKPWDWRLVGVEHPLLHMSNDFE